MKSHNWNSLELFSILLSSSYLLLLAQDRDITGSDYFDLSALVLPQEEAAHENTKTPDNFRVSLYMDHKIETK
jgi:hypothetical protein